MTRIVMTIIFVILTLWTTVTLWRGDWVAYLPVPTPDQVQAQTESGLIEKMQLAKARRGRELKEMTEKVEAMQARLQTVAKLERRLEQLSRRKLPMDGGSVDVTHTDPDWHLNDIFTKRRVYEKRIPFKRHFGVTPTVILGLRHLHVGQNELHLALKAKKIDSGGFTLRMETRSDERLRAIGVDWMAFSPYPSDQP